MDAPTSSSSHIFISQHPRAILNTSYSNGRVPYTWNKRGRQASKWPHPYAAPDPTKLSFFASAYLVRHLKTGWLGRNPSKCPFASATRQAFGAVLFATPKSSVCAAPQLSLQYTVQPSGRYVREESPILTTKYPINYYNSYLGNMSYWPIHTGIELFGSDTYYCQT